MTGSYVRLPRGEELHPVAQELINGIISYNIIRENLDGLNMQWHSNNTLVSNNIISENKYYGHWHVTNYHCTIRNNYYADNGWEELYVNQNEYETGNNSIYHNTIIGYAYDDGINIWYDKYPSGGNYWRDYSGKDKYHGPNQDIPGSDGIGDTPYQIPDGNNQDKYPLMDPIPVTPLGLDGPDEGLTCIDYTFSATTIDPRGEKLWYLFDWGDGTNSGWVGPYASGNPSFASKIWNEGGDYKIRVKVKDVNDRESDWSPEHTIAITAVSKLEIGIIRGGLFKVRVSIKNAGAADATDVQWNIKLDGGAFFVKETTGSEDIPVGVEKTVNSKLILGFGETKITVTAEVSGGLSDTRLQNGFIYLFFIKVKPGCHP